MCALVTPISGEVVIDISAPGGDSLPQLLHSPGNVWYMFYFVAERMQVGEAESGYANRLHPNAGNLPNVLHTLSGERGDVFQRLVRHLR